MDGGLIEVTEAMAAAAHAERATARLQALQAQLDAERRAVAELQQRLGAEERDVVRLEGMSIRSVVASIRGRRDRELAAERAEADGVRLELSVRWEAIRALEADAAAWAPVAASLPAASDSLHRALAEREAMLRAEPSALGAELTRLGDEAAAARAELRECDEALHAAVAAGDALAAAARALASAGGWSTYDTFFGGGLIASSIKHGRLRDAAHAVAAAQHAMLRLRAELHDVGMAHGWWPDPPSDALRTMDVWFDNIVSDWMVHNRIKASRQSVDAARHGVAAADNALRQYRGAVTVRLDELDGRRRALLTTDAGG